jgi:hypothetical protein
METQVSSIEVRLSAAREPPNRHGAADYCIAAISSAFLRDFDRTAEVTGMPLRDPLPTFANGHAAPQQSAAASLGSRQSTLMPTPSRAQNGVEIAGSWSPA